MTLASSCQSQHYAQSGNSYLPVNVAHIEDGAISAMNARVASRKFDGNGSETEVGTHCEISDRGHHGYQGGDVVKDAVGTRLGE